MMGLSKLKDFVTLSASWLSSVGEIYFWTGSPGDNLIRIKIKLTSKKITITEVNNLFNNAYKREFLKVNLVYSPFP